MWEISSWNVWHMGSGSNYLGFYLTRPQKPMIRERAISNTSWWIAPSTSDTESWGFWTIKLVWLMCILFLCTTPHCLWCYSSTAPTLDQIKIIKRTCELLVAKSSCGPSTPSLHLPTADNGWVWSFSYGHLDL